MKFVLIFAIVIGSTAWGSQHEGKHSHPKTEKVTTPSRIDLSSVKGDAVIEVNGMVCSFCAQGIEKKLKAESAVKEVRVDLDSKVVVVDFKKGKSIPEKKLRELIVNSGYNVERVSYVKRKKK